jgi:hypothetical protein
MSRSRKATVALLATVFAAAVLWFTNRSVTPVKATWEDVVAEAKQGGYRLIGLDELKTHYEKERDRLLLVDTRQEWEYRTGHIQGALSFPMEPTWFSRWKKRAALEAFLGPDHERLIVFY